MTRAYAVSAVAACVVSAVFVVIARLTGLVSAGQVNWVVGVWFVVSAMAWCIFTLQDSVLAGLRQAPWIPVENGLFSSVKILLLLALASVSQRYGLFLSLTIPVVLSLIPVNLFLFRRAIPEVGGARPRRLRAARSGGTSVGLSRPTTRADCSRSGGSRSCR